MYNLGMIHILHSQATPEQIAEMSKEYETMIKIVVDIRGLRTGSFGKWQRTG
jgi:hypothetical protein